MELVFIGNWMINSSKKFLIEEIFPHSHEKKCSLVVISLFTPENDNTLTLSSIFESNSNDQKNENRTNIEIIQENDQVLKHLLQYQILTLPWKIKIDQDNSVIYSQELLITSSSSSSSSDPSTEENNLITELFTKGIEASNDGNYVNALKWFSLF